MTAHFKVIQQERTQEAGEIRVRNLNPESGIVSMRDHQMVIPAGEIVVMMSIHLGYGYPRAPERLRADTS